MRIKQKYLEFNILFHQSRIAKILVTCVFSVVILLFGYWLLLKPELNELDNLLNEEEEKKQLIDIRKAFISTKKITPNTLNTLKQKISKHQASFMNDDDKAQVLVSINQLAIKNNLMLRQLFWKEKTTTIDDFERLPLEMILVGRFNDIGSFSEALANLPTLIVINEKQWSKHNEKDKTLVFEAKGYGYLSKRTSL